MTNADSGERLRAKRQLIADQRKNNELRLDAAPSLVAIVNRALVRRLTMDDFSHTADTLGTFIWPKRLEDAPGLVAAYVDRAMASTILSCIGRRLGSLTGFIGFHDKAFLGFARAAMVEPAALLAIAEGARDAVLLYVDQPHGAVLVDWYETPGSNPCSVIVQGDLLVAEAAGCFEPR